MTDVVAADVADVADATRSRLKYSSMMGYMPIG